MTGVAVLGSTGSIGTNALKVIERLGSGFRVTALAAGSNGRALAEQARQLRPELVVIGDEAAAAELREQLPEGTELAIGADGLRRAASMSVTDMVVLAVTGAAGLPAALAAAQSGKRLALANKESMVMAGALLTGLARTNGARIIPVDSEHSAIFQAMHSGRAREVRRIIITASGGPFLDTPAAELRRVTPQQALNHPTWSMGQKITIDSATLMNKALEVIEAHWLFGLSAEQIEVVVHPQSIVHSLVEFCDRSVVAQMGYPDMQLPIQYALTYPDRKPTDMEGLDLAAVGSLEFRAPDVERFPSLALGYRAVREGGTAGAVFNAAGEVATAAFIDGRIGFCDIAEVVERTMDCCPPTPDPTIEEILGADATARSMARDNCNLKLAKD